jgi:hypothetical protein
MYRELIAGVVALVIAFAAGWGVQGWRKDAETNRLIAVQAQATLAAEAKARKAEQAISVAVQNARSESDAKIKQVRANLERTISQLRNRPERTIQVPTVTAAPTEGCTGTKLFRQDAEFLIREATRADELEAALRQCETTYSAARTELNKE